MTHYEKSNNPGIKNYFIRRIMDVCVKANREDILMGVFPGHTFTFPPYVENANYARIFTARHGIPREFYRPIDKLSPEHLKYLVGGV